MTRKAWQFFKANAEYATPPGAAVCAASLARAEEWKDAEVEAGRLRVRWVADDDPSAALDVDDSIRKAQKHAIDLYGVDGCIIERRCDACGSWQHVASLWGIVGDRDYHRVVEAELAAEAKDGAQ